MRKFILVPVLIATALLLIASATFGSEADELREKAKKAKEEAVELKKLGRREESEKLARKAKELLEAAEKPEIKRRKVSLVEMEKLHRHLNELIDRERRMKASGASEEDLAEIRNQIIRTQREIGGTLSLVGGIPAAPPIEMIAQLEEAGRKIKHLRIAAENLHAAGADDLAKQLMRQVDEMERAAREAKMRMMEGAELRGGQEMGSIPSQIEELRREVGRLREEMKELGQHVKELERARK